MLHFFLPLLKSSKTITEIFNQLVFELVRPNSTFHNTNSNLSVWTTFMLNSHQISSRLALGRYKFRVFGHLKFRVFYAKNSKWSSQIFQFKTLYWTILEDFSVKLNPAACIFLWLEAKIGLSRMISIYVVLCGSHFAGFASLPLSRAPRVPDLQRLQLEIMWPPRWTALTLH